MSTTTTRTTSTKLLLGAAIAAMVSMGAMGAASAAPPRPTRAFPAMKVVKPLTRADLVRFRTAIQAHQVRITPATARELRAMAPKRVSVPPGVLEVQLGPKLQPVRVVARPAS